MASDRVRRMVNIATKNNKPDPVLEYLNLPAYESTKGTSREDADKILDLYASTIGRNEDNEEPEQNHFSDSGSEYIPSDQSETSESSNNGEAENDLISAELPDNTRKVTNANSPQNRNEITSSTDKFKLKKKKHRYQLLSTDEITSSTSDCTNKEIIINHSMKINNKRFRNKYHACYFCHKLIQNMARHFVTKHSSELEIIRISTFPKNSLRRRKEYGEIIKAGDFYHNCEVLSTKVGELILVRRPTERELMGVTYSDYGPCPKCLGFLLKRHLWHHVKYTCTKVNHEHDGEDSSNSKFVLCESASLMNGILQTEFPTNYISNVVDKLRSDEIGTQIRSDNLILRFGAFLYEKYGDTQLELVRQNMRQLSRLLLELNKLNPSIKCISDSLNPDKFDVVIEATKALSLRNEGAIVSRPTFVIPSLALKIGYALKKCIGIERGQALRQSNIKRDKTLKSFEKLLQLEWNVRISSNALASLHSRKLNNTELLPITNDLLVLSRFLEQELKVTRAAIEENYSTALWTKLASLTLMRIVLFNKRRSGEAARMTLAQYSSRPVWDKRGAETLQEALSPFERELAKSLFLVNIVGKRGRHVPVILTAEMKQTIDLLIQLRGKVDIVAENPFLFALGGNSLRHIRGHDALKRWCTEANLQCPELITGTKLRKYIATVCQVFNLTENQTDWLARHLGHDIRVHREFYRLHDNAVELAKVSRLLIAVDQGQAEKFAGKRLEDINVKDLPDVEEDATAETVSDEENVDKPENEGIANYESKEIEINNVTKKKKQEMGRKKSDRQLWTSDESALVLKTFKQCIKYKQLPGKADCEKLIASNPELFKNRKWTHIKFYVKNHLTKVERMKGSTK